MTGRRAGRSTSTKRLAIAFSVLLIGFLSVGDGQCEESSIGDASTRIQSLAPLIEQVIQTVVSVDVTVQTLEAYPVIGADSGFPDGPVPVTRKVYGAGVVVDADLGLVVTSNHVVKGADSIRVLLFDGRQMGASIAVADEDADLAVLRIGASGLSASPLGKSDGPEPGDFVLAIGDPLGLSHSATFGMISGLHRSWPGIPYRDLIQTDVLLDRGSSGGPLFNLRGEVIGINTARAGEAAASERSFGFAVPVSAVGSLLLRLRKPDY